MTAYIKDQSCSILNERNELVYVCPVHESVDGTKMGMFTRQDLMQITALEGSIDIEFRFANDTARDFTPTIPEIVGLIASLLPSVLKLLSTIKGKKQEKLDAITEILKVGHTDGEKILLITQIAKL